MSEKFDKFMPELEALCMKHRVQLASEEYDALQVWDLDPSTDEPLYFTDIQDRTK